MPIQILYRIPFVNMFVKRVKSISVMEAKKEKLNLIQALNPKSDKTLLTGDIITSTNGKYIILSYAVRESSKPCFASFKINPTTKKLTQISSIDTSLPPFVPSMGIAVYDSGKSI